MIYPVIHSGKNKPWSLLSLFWLVVLATIPTSHALAQVSTPLREMRSGWYPRTPYQMETRVGGRRELTGLEIHVAKELFGRAGYEVSFDAMAWSDMLDGLRAGDMDFVMGAYFEEYRTGFARFSRPYRTERNVVYYHEGIQGASLVRGIDDLIEFLENNPLRMAIIGTPDDYAYGSTRFTDFLKDPPETFRMVPSGGYNDSMNLVMLGRADLFVANPVIGDRLLAETGYSDRIRKMAVEFPEMPVHIMFSRHSVSQEQVEAFDSILASMLEENRIRALHREFLLPVYLSIATQQYWFDLLSLLGIAAFCFSGVLLARKEHYNLFGALVLATLPAIGGGVLRDLFLGVDQVFVLESPKFMVAAIAVVLVSFVGFKSYDYLYGTSRERAGKIGGFVERRLGWFYGRLFKFFDAWAVAIFSVIGVNVALETQADPLWLWGPAMAAVTASGGVVLRDIVRADFNIEMLKQDSYAEISILGGVLYTGGLMLLPHEMNLDLIFNLTMVGIASLFAIRFFILWKGYANPLQFGARYARPKSRLERFTRLEPDLWMLVAGYYQEDREGKARHLAEDELEERHSRFIYARAELRDFLDQVAAEPLDPASVRKYRQSGVGLEQISLIEENLFSYLIRLPHPLADKPPDRPAPGLKLQQHMHESLKTLIDTTLGAVESGEAMDFSLLEELTSRQHERFNRLRAKYAVRQEQEDDAALEAVLMATHRVERIIDLLGDYARLRLDKKKTDLGSAFSRKAQQELLLR
jgi:polar amino acid transport system substrate-binding protein